MYEKVRRKIFGTCENLGIVLNDDVAVLLAELVKIRAISGELAATIERDFDENSG